MSCSQTAGPGRGVDSGVLVAGCWTLVGVGAGVDVGTDVLVAGGWSLVGIGVPVTGDCVPVKVGAGAETMGSVLADVGMLTARGCVPAGAMVGVLEAEGRVLVNGGVLVGSGPVGNTVSVAETASASAVPGQTASMAGAAGLQAATSHNSARTNRKAIPVRIRLRFIATTRNTNHATRFTFHA